MADAQPERQVRDEDLDGIDIDILADGTVRLHTTCKPGQDPSECAARVQFLVDALGLPLDGVVTEVSREPAAERD